uniref:DUF659 domain-containing protein n=1 Tax=Oryza brachyantha TaxID=4533 RepID=J3LVB9_ORYBR
MGKYMMQEQVVLISVIALNSRGRCFLYAKDFSGVERTEEAIVEFLLKTIDEIGLGHVLQVVTDNIFNCKSLGKETEKITNYSEEFLKLAMMRISNVYVELASAPKQIAPLNLVGHLKVTSADLMIAGDQSGWNALSNAATPDTCGQAIEVPEKNLYESSTAAKILDPGAATSGYRNLKVLVTEVN